MSMIRYFSNLTRPQGDPKIISTGPSSVASIDKVGKALGWFSLGLGVAELLVPRRITQTLGMEGAEALVRTYGLREIAAGIASLSVDRQAGLWSRVIGDGFDVVTLLTGLRSDNPKQNNVASALLMVAGISILDLIAAQAATARHARGRRQLRLYRDRSGFPKGIQASKGVARDSLPPYETHAAAP